MHELSVAQNIIEIIRENVPRSDYDNVKRILLEVGEFSGIVADSLQFCFDIIKTDTEFKNAIVQIKKIPFVLYCKNCKTETSNNSGIRLCSECGGSNTEIISGTEMKITEVEINS